MKQKHLSLLFVFAAFILGFITRYYLLGKAPAGLYLDEAAQGYSAYSLLHTGKDEFGKPFPFVFRSFLDFKTPIYIYLIVPLIPLFGLTAFTVRFPSFFFSVLTFPLLYAFLRSLLPPKYRFIAALTTFLLALSPWHILFGRTTFECNVALFFLLAGTYAFYSSLRHPRFLYLCSVLWAIAIPAYHAQRIVTPFVALVLFYRYRSILFSKTHIRHFFLSGCIGFLLLLPTLSISTTPGFLARASGLNIFSHSRQMPAGYLDSYHGFGEAIINSSLFLSTKEFLSLYSSYFSPRSMFILGDYGPRSSYPSLGTFFLWQFPFYVYGFYLLLKEKQLKEFRFFTLLLLFIAPIPAAVTRDPYTTIRALPLCIPQLSIIALGFFSFYKRFPKISLVTIGVLSFYSLFRLYSSGIVLNEYFRANEWNYGWEEVSTTIKTLDSTLPIVVDNTRSEPYSQLLFYLQFDPATYQSQNFEVPLSEYYTAMTRNTTKIIGNITTRPIEWKVDTLRHQYLVGDSLSISDGQMKEHNFKLVRDIFYPDHTLAFRVVEVIPKK
jgi:4-amino-4-deoxy-L-arabinose transferase-like glycosyltransferase